MLLTMGGVPRTIDTIAVIKQSANASKDNIITEDQIAEISLIEKGIQDCYKDTILPPYALTQSNAI